MWAMIHDSSSSSSSSSSYLYSTLSISVKYRVCPHEIVNCCGVSKSTYVYIHIYMYICKKYVFIIIHSYIYIYIHIHVFPTYLPFFLVDIPWYSYNIPMYCCCCCCCCRCWFLTSSRGKRGPSCSNTWRGFRMWKISGVVINGGNPK